MTTSESGPEIAARLDFDSHAAVFLRAMAHLDNAATKELDRVDFDLRLRELVRIRASQINGCAYCIDMHTKDARALGETEQRLYGLVAWSETPYFTDRERAALAFTETVTRLADDHVPTKSYDAVAARFNADDRRADRSDRRDQCLEHDQRQYASLGPWLLQPLKQNLPESREARLSGMGQSLARSRQQLGDLLGAAPRSGGSAGVGVDRSPARTRHRPPEGTRRISGRRLVQRGLATRT